MSINSCTLDCSTIDAICSQRRQIIINDLIDQLPQGNKSHQQRINPIHDNFRILRRDVDNEDNVDISTIELPYIVVTVEFNGETYIHNMDRGDDNFRPMINVYDMSSVNIPIINIYDLFVTSSRNNVEDFYPTISISGLALTASISTSVSISDIKIRMLT